MFSVIDLVFIVLILLSAIICMFKGFIKEIFSKGAFVLATILGVLFYPNLDVYFSRLISIEILSKIFSFIFIFIVVFLLVKVVQAILSNFFAGDILKGLDRALGLFLGIAEGMGLVFVILFVLYVQPWFSADAFFEGSFFYSVFCSFLPDVANKLNMGVV